MLTQARGRGSGVEELMRPSVDAPKHRWPQHLEEPQAIHLCVGLARRARQLAQLSWIRTGMRSPLGKSRWWLIQDAGPGLCSLSLGSMVRMVLQTFWDSNRALLMKHGKPLPQRLLINFLLKLGSQFIELCLLMAYSSATRRIQLDWVFILF